MATIVSNKVTWHPVTMPSRGIYYDGKCPDGNVDITPWTTAQEELFIRYGGSKPTELIHRLIQGNVRLPAGMIHDDLLITDRYFLLFQLRAISLVPQYTFMHKCPQCKIEHQVTMNINTLLVKVPDFSDPEPFEVKLPVNGSSVHVRLFRVSDELKMEEYEALIFKNVQDPGSPAHRFKLARQIEKINGATPKFDEKISFVSNLVWADLQMIRKTVEKYETGYVMDIETQCPRGGCGFTHKWVLPFDDSFFRPLDADFEAAFGDAGGPRKTDSVPGREGV